MPLKTWQQTFDPAYRLHSPPESLNPCAKRLLAKVCPQSFIDLIETIRDISNAPPKSNQTYMSLLSSINFVKNFISKGTSACSSPSGGLQMTTFSVNVSVDDVIERPIQRTRISQARCFRPFQYSLFVFSIGHNAAVRNRVRYSESALHVPCRSVKKLFVCSSITSWFAPALRAIM
jgi:hypothetical protein